MSRRPQTQGWQALVSIAEANAADNPGSSHGAPGVNGDGQKPPGYTKVLNVIIDHCLPMIGPVKYAVYCLLRRYFDDRRARHPATVPATIRR